MGVLNRTIERAPTSPSERASDDFTTVMMRIVVMTRRGNTCANSERFESVDPNRSKCQRSTSEIGRPTARLISREVIESGAAVPKIIACEEVPTLPVFSSREFTTDTAKPFVGNYRRDDGTHTSIVLDGSVLRTGGGILVPTDGDRFFSPTYGCDVTFDMTAEGDASALVYRPLDMAPIIFHRVWR